MDQIWCNQMAVMYVTGIWGGNVNRILPPVSFGMLMAGIVKCDSWLSKIKRTGSSLQINKMLHVVTKSLSFAQPVVFTSPTEVVGTPVNMCFLKCTLGCINIGGTWLNGIYRNNHCDIYSSLPWSLILHLLESLAQIVLEGILTVELPVSSNL